MILNRQAMVVLRPLLALTFAALILLRPDLRMQPFLTMLREDEMPVAYSSRVRKSLGPLQTCAQQLVWIWRAP